MPHDTPETHIGHSSVMNVLVASILTDASTGEDDDATGVPDQVYGIVDCVIHCKFLAPLEPCRYG